MSANVPPFPPPLGASIFVDANYVRNGAAVRGDGQWRNFAQAALWLLGRGGSLVTAGPSEGAIAAGASHTYRYYCWPHEVAMARLWVVGVAGENAAASAFGTLEASGSSVGAHPWSITGVFSGDVTPIIIADPLTTPTGTAGEVTLTISVDAASANSVRVASVCCYELPRASLTTLSGVAVPDDQTLGSGRHIYYDAGSVESVSAVLGSQVGAITHARRSGLFSWWNHAGVVITDASYPSEIAGGGGSNVFGGGIPIITRNLYAGETQRSIAWAVYAKRSGSDGKVKLWSSRANAESEVTITDTSGAWVTGTLLVETEDPNSLSSSMGGIRGGVRENVAALVHRGAGGGDSVTLYGLCMGEA
jgi:hypothetical protein